MEKEEQEKVEEVEEEEEQEKEEVVSLSARWGPDPVPPPMSACGTPELWRRRVDPVPPRSCIHSRLSPGAVTCKGCRQGAPEAGGKVSLTRGTSYRQNPGSQSKADSL